MTINWHILAADTIERRLEFAALPRGWAAVAAIVLLASLLLAAILLYRREQRVGLTPHRRILLTALRCAVIAVLAAVWLEPVLATYLHRQIDSETLVLVDSSASMNLRDPHADASPARVMKRIVGGGVRRITRAQLVERALAGDDAALLKQLAVRNPVRIYQFADDLAPVGYMPRGGALQPPSAASSAAATQPAGPRHHATAESLLAPLARAEGAATDIGRAVRSAVEMAGDTPIAAVVVLSDGRFNRGESAEVVARFAQARKIPIYAVGVGDPAESRNVAVAAVTAPANVFVKDPFDISARLECQGLGGQTLTVELIKGDGDSAEPLDRKTVTVDASGQVGPIVFKHQLAEAGQVHLAVRVAPLEDETIAGDNQREVIVRALDNKMRVLVVAGGPSWDYRYLTRLLTRDATMDLSCWLQSADETAVRDGKTAIDHFPAGPEELAGYDCIVLMDPQLRDFPPQWAAAVEAMVADKGTGLLYVAGRTHTPRFVQDPSTRPLVDMLPVAIEPGEAELTLNELGHFQTAPWPVAVPADAAGHPVLALADSTSENLQIWSSLPGWFWHYPVSRAKPVATVLLRDSNPRMRGPDGGHVLLATQFVGSGRTGFLASDSTWRWRRMGEQYFNRFWVQLLRHLTEGKLFVGQKRGFVQTERDRYTVGEAVVVEARLTDEHHQPLKTDQVHLLVRGTGQPDGTVTLQPQTNRPGWYRGRWVPTHTGRYDLQIELPGGPGVEPAAIRHELRVDQADLEFRQTSLDRQTLRLLASESSGGQYLALGEVPRLADLIPSRQVSLVLSGEPTKLWDRWWTLLLLVGLLGAEWFLRKRACLL